MQPCHTLRATSAVFDDPNLVSSAGLVPVVALDRAAGLTELATEQLSVPTDKGANAGLKVTSLVAGMVAGADSIDDMAILRHGAMGKVFANAYAPSTLGSFLRTFTFGHVRQLDAVASRFLTNLSDRSSLLTPGQRVMVDLDDTIIEVHGHTKQGSGYGYTRVRGLNALIATATTADTAPVVVAQRLRKGSCGSPRGSGRLVGDALRTTKKMTAQRAGTVRIVLRADSAPTSATPPSAPQSGPGRRCRSRPHRPRRSGSDQPDPRRRLDADRVHRRDLRRKRPRGGSPAPRSPRSRSPRSPRRRRPTTSPDASSYAASPT